MRNLCSAEDAAWESGATGGDVAVTDQEPWGYFVHGKNDYSTGLSTDALYSREVMMRLSKCETLDKVRRFLFELPFFVLSPTITTHVRI